MSKEMPVVFSGHGDPMIALAHNDLTAEMNRLREKIIEDFGKPRAILAISGHWIARGTLVQRTENPRQIYDMYGFPKELYEVKYPVAGDLELSDRVLSLLGSEAAVDNSWGIDHGSWTVLVHMFPGADIPVVQLSVNSTLESQQHYAIGKKLSPLRDEGYLILGSGNVVHNLRKVNWDNPGGTKETVDFNQAIRELIERRDDEAVIRYRDLPNAAYAVPTPDHFLPLLYILGASEGEKPFVFNDVCNLGAIAMTGYAFGL